MFKSMGWDVPYCPVWNSGISPRLFKGTIFDAFILEEHIFNGIGILGAY
tara:strand:- start:336 stop:482 length:147 start_codon:yes stop_codon:yes gene_type:complete